MPLYQYYCEENDRIVEVSHTVDAKLTTWGEVCFVAQISLGETDPMAPVKRVIRGRPPAVSVSVFNSELKDKGFTKLVKRDDGVYENVTAIDGEERYMKRGDAGSRPHINKKVGD